MWEFIGLFMTKNVESARCAQRKKVESRPFLNVAHVKFTYMYQRQKKLFQRVPHVTYYKVKHS